MKTTIQQTYPEGVAATRNRLGLTQQQFAEELGISRSMVNMVERNLRNLPSPALIKFSKPGDTTICNGK